jgi:thiosulfate reductase/polysulfide reductase chain A
MTENKTGYSADRRSFLKLTAALTTTAMGGGYFLPRSSNADVVEMVDIPEGKWIPTCCHMCAGGTGIEVKVVDGRAVDIRPNAENPLGVCNVSQDYEENKKQGAVICPKGNAGLMALYDPDRVKKPLKRTNPEKGKDVDPGWQEITWDEALNEITKKLKQLKDAGEPEALQTFSESATATYAQQDFTNLFGTPNYSVHSNLCSAGRAAASSATFGVGEALGDFANTKYGIIFGWNPFAAIKWSHLPRMFQQGIERGMKLVVVDPWCNETAARAHDWVPIRVGTDGALALAMAHVIIKEELYDKEFVSKWSNGFDEYKEYVKDKTPEWAEEVTSVPADNTRKLARDFAMSKAAIADGWIGPGQHSNAVNNLRAIFILNLLKGNVDQPGGMILPQGGKFGGTFFKTFKIDKPRFDGNERFPMRHSSGAYVETINRLLDGDEPYKLKVGIATMQNLVMSIPGTDKVIEALKKLEMLVVVDTHLSETALMADLVLPGTTYLERYDTVTRGLTWPIVALRQPVVKPIFGQLSEPEIFMELGKRLGLVDASGEKVYENLTFEEYFDKRLKGSTAKLGLQEIKKLPGAVWRDEKGTRYNKFRAKLDVSDRKDIEITDGIVYELEKDQAGNIIPDGKKNPIGAVVDGEYFVGVNNPSRRFDFVTQRLKDKKDFFGRVLSGLPEYWEREWKYSKEYPLSIVSWRQASHTHTRTFNNPYLMGIKNSNPLLINSKTALMLGIKDGDEIWIESPHQKDKGVAKVVEGMHPEVVGFQHGFGHWGFGKVAQGKGTGTGQFNLPKADYIAGQAIHKEVYVKVYKA